MRSDNNVEKLGHRPRAASVKGSKAAPKLIVPIAKARLGLNHSQPQTHAGAQRLQFQHGFVVLDTLSTETQRAARKLAECFSDNVKQPTPTLLYGSLKNTACYFRDASHLYNTLFQQWSQGPCCDGVRVVLSANLFRGYAYARTQSTAIVLASPDNIHYRRFLEGIDWKTWFESALHFLGLFSFTTAEKQRSSQKLKEFCEHMHTMRFRTPSALASKARYGELQRRFGSLVAHLWCLWDGQESDLSFLPHLSHLDVFDPSELSTTLSEVESFETRYSIAPQELQGAVVELFVNCLHKVKARNTQDWHFSLRDFCLEIFCNDHLRIQEHVSLALPVSDMTKTARLILERATEKVCATKVHRERFEGGPSFEYTIHSIEDIRITPVQLCCQRRSREVLFESDHSKKSLVECKKILELKDNSPQVALFSLGSDIGEQTSFHQINDLESKFSESFCRHLFYLRPIVNLKKPVPLSMTTLKQKFPEVKIVYTETVGLSDCFIATLDPNDAKSKLWLKAFSSERRLSPWQRNYQLAGYFSSHFQVPSLFEV